MKEARVSILGTKYTVNEVEQLKNGGGEVDFYEKNISILRIDESEETSLSAANKIMNDTITHEIIHAFLFESGLAANSKECLNWATNEEMIDFFSLQLSKIHEVLQIVYSQWYSNYPTKPTVKKKEVNDEKI